LAIPKQTGPGGRIRDVQAAGKGAHVIAGTAGYSVGNLHLPGYNLPWERREAHEQHPSDFARPADILVQASNGASDYGNKFGEPLISGFCRSFGQRTPDGERIEYIKPIMFSGGIGSIDAQYVTKGTAELGMHLVKVGGPVYRIGVGGGAASSVEVQGGEESATLNFNAVQRGDPEMEQKMNRVIRGCIESEVNPIHAIHDQGAGGNGNVLKEIAEPEGAVIYTDRFTLGDPTIDTLELWGAEFQESNALLVHERHLPLVKSLGHREKCQVDVVGEITGDGRIQLIEPEEKRHSSQHPVDLNLEHVLGSMPRKLFRMQRIERISRPLQLPTNLTVQLALQQVLRLPSVCSKRFLTNKVDRSVTGLVAQQQCIGPLHTPLADYAAIALAPWDTVGAVTAIGEQPIKGMICARSGGEMSVAEMITNMMFACITELKDVKCSGNWMWAAKLAGEGARLVDTCEVMCNRLSQLNVAIDGGKDSLSMAAVLRRPAPAAPELIKAPGTLVLSGYAPMPDIRRKVTPLLSSGAVPSRLLYIPLHANNQQWAAHAPRLGGSALSQSLGQLGDQPPRMEDGRILGAGFNIVQDLIRRGWCLAGHDVSDGGLLGAVLEMAFASDCGLQLQLQPEAFGWDEYTDDWSTEADLKLGNDRTPSRKSSVHSRPTNASSITPSAVLSLLFNEEVGVVIEVLEKNVVDIEELLLSAQLACVSLGTHTPNDARIRVLVADQCVLDGDVHFWRDVWEETSYQLELLQTDRECAKSERAQLRDGKRHVPNWKVTFDANQLPRSLPIERPFSSNPSGRVAVWREEGSNGDREMISALFESGFQVIDVTTSDLIEGRFSLNTVNGLVFPGGFSFADVLGSARGWAASVSFNKRVSQQLEEFKARSDTWSLGVCNGCQLMALIGWVGPNEKGTQDFFEVLVDCFLINRIFICCIPPTGEQGTQLQHNRSERFESRFSSVKIQNSNSVLLKDMSGSVLGVWVAHGEGRFAFRAPEVLERVRSRNLIALSYVDDDNQETTE
jgi:phosphoribosylformylglycinamidine synthase